MTVKQEYIVVDDHVTSPELVEAPLASSPEPDWEFFAQQESFVTEYPIDLPVGPHYFDDSEELNQKTLAEAQYFSIPSYPVPSSPPAQETVRPSIQRTPRLFVQSSSRPLTLGSPSTCPYGLRPRSLLHSAVKEQNVPQERRIEEQRLVYSVLEQLRVALGVELSDKDLLEFARSRL